MGNLGFGYCAVHPGELLKDEVEYRGVSQRKLATQMGMSYNILNDILNERHTVTANTAMLFEAALGVSADLIMRMQLKYNMQMARKDKSFAERLEEVRKMCAVL